jgi:hypothetical protein
MAYRRARRITTGGIMGGFLIAWLVGMTLNVTHESYIYRRVDPQALAANTTGKGPSALPPKPGKLLIASGIYVGLAVLAESQQLRSTATLAAWGYNIAIGIQFAQDVAQDKATAGSGSPTGTIKNSGFWQPPSASSDVLFPNGTGGSPHAKPTSATGTGTQAA